LLELRAKTEPKTKKITKDSLNGDKQDKASVEANNNRREPVKEEQEGRKES